MSSYMDDDDSSHSASNDNEGGLRMSLRERPRQKHLKLKKMIDDDLKFLGDFDPEKSSRERRKLTRKTYAQPAVLKSTIYDDRGRLRDNYMNVCDCMDERCSGCFFPCSICDSSKCGPTCRIHRKYTYDTIEFDGKDGVIRNKHANKN